MISSALCRRIDDTFGPYAEGCRGGFDFTLLFEESLLSILPQVLLFGIIPLRILYLARRSIKVEYSLLSPTKPVCHP